MSTACQGGEGVDKVGEWHSSVFDSVRNPIHVWIPVSVTLQLTHRMVGWGVLCVVTG